MRRNWNISFMSRLLPAILLLAAGFPSISFGQCPNNNDYYGVNLTPSTCPGNAYYGCMYMGEYVTVDVVQGNTYVFTSCDEFLFDTEITVYNSGTGALISYNDDDCGAQSTVTWTADFTGTVNVLLNWYPCDETTLFCIPLEVICFSSGSGGGSGGDICNDALPFCTGTTYSFPNNINVPDLGWINCLFTSPNPVWYYMEIDQPGDLDISIQQYSNLGVPIDVDFLLWGPFTDLPNACTAINSNPENNVVDCSYSGSAFEEANITGAQTGEVYVLLLTNFSNQSGTISFNSLSSSTATTNCDILCDIVSLTATPSACDPTNNSYELTGTVLVNNPPGSGTLTITSSCGGTTTLSAPFTPSMNYSIPGINSAGGSCTVTAEFSEDPSCSLTTTFSAPASCATVSLNCPQYASVSTSPSIACSNQTYYLEVANTGCNGQIYMTVVGNWGSLYAEEISWTLISNQTGGVIAQGFGNTGLNGQNINVPIGPLNPAVTGTIFTLFVDDSFGDGFNGTGGYVQVMQGSEIIGGPIAGAIGFGASTIFGANISISPATITINTPSGPVVQTVEFCRDFRVPLSVDNPNFCNTINVNLPWSITCNTTGAVISSGSNNITVYPQIPATSNDVVTISFDNASCEWEVSPNNDCDAGDIGSIFTISPDPSGISYPACTGGQQSFTVVYNGLGSGPDCCSTGGTPIPTVQSQTFTNSNMTVASSPFGGVNNAALLSIPANLIGGNATSFNLQFDLNNYCFNPPGTTLSDFWVTIVVDGNIISDQNVPVGTTSYSINLDISDIPGGFTSNSVIQIYTYPNAFNAGAVFTTYNPAANCASLADGVWKADFSGTLDVTYSELQPTPADCNLDTDNNYECCENTIVADLTETICSGDAFQLSTWQSQVEAANGPCVVYSSVAPVPGSIAPDNNLPNGINNTSSDITQTVQAYSYCDLNGNSVVDVGDTYTLISNYSITINYQSDAGSNNSVNVCESASAFDLFSVLGGTPQSGGNWSGPSTLGNGEAGTFTPGLNSAGVYTYTVPGHASCSDATAQVTVSVSTSPDASFIYNGAPFCTSITTPQAPVISGTAGGTFSISPAGLSINSTTGAVTPSSSVPGTYTVTYSIAASGSCPAYSIDNYLVITDIPSNPSLLPNPICAGSPVTLTATGGTWFEFFVNDVSQSLPSADNTFDWTTPVAGDEVCVRSYPLPPFVFNGNISEPEWMNPLSTSSGGATSGFGPNYLDALYLQNMGGYLFGAIAGQTENNSNNRILIFIDCIPGGYNNLGSWTNRGNAPYVSVENLSSDITFDPGFNPDFIICMNQATGIAYFDLYDMQNNINYYLGSDAAADGILPAGLLGYQPNGTQGNELQGFEFGFPLSLIGNPTGTIQTFCMLVNDPGQFSSAPTFISNQFLSPAAAGELNYGDGFIDFGAALPDPVDYSLSADCYSENCITVTPSIPPLTGFTYTPSVCEDNVNIVPVPESGFTAGGSYSSTSGLVINSSTGEIDIAASNPGTYTITYSVPANGCNPAASGSFDITIYPLPSTTPIYHE